MQHDPADNEFSSLVRAILAHVVRHPDAKDSVDGIRDFWLPPQSGRLSRELVRAALDHLVDERGWFTRKVSGAAVALYGLDKNCLVAVRNYLSGARAD